MAKFERGVYEPSDEVRVFDGSEEEDDIEGSRLPLLIVLALLVLAMFGGVVWLAYTQGVARGRGETPVLTAAGGPERVAPQQAGGNAGGSDVPYQGFKIYEQPAPPDDSGDAAAPAAAPKPAPVAAEPKPAQVAAPAPAPAKAPAPVVPPAAPKVAVTAPPPAKAMAPTPPKSMAALIQQANSMPEPAKPAPAAKAPKPAAASPAPVGGPATGAPRQLAAAAPASAPAPAATGGGYVLQIGAYKSQADADTAWKTYKARHAALLTGYSNNVQQVDLGEKGTWYRLRIGGLADREVANALCDRLKADGGACMLGR